MHVYARHACRALIEDVLGMNPKAGPAPAPAQDPRRPLFDLF